MKYTGKVDILFKKGFRFNTDMTLIYKAVRNRLKPKENLYMYIDLKTKEISFTGNEKLKQYLLEGLEIE